MTMNQTDIMNLIQQGQKLLSEGKHNQAIELAEKLTLMSPDSADSHLLLAIAYQQVQSHAKAYQEIEKVIALAATNEMAHLLRIRLSKLIHPSRQTVQLCNTSLQTFPQNGQLWFELSQLYHLDSKIELADEAFKNHLIFSATAPLLKQAMASFFEKDFLASEQAVRKHLSKQPKDVNALRLLGEIALNLGIYEDAQRLFEKALQLAPKYHLARLNYAHVLNKREQNIKAFEQLGILEKYQPNHPPVLCVKAAVLVKLGRYSDAINIYTNLLSRQPAQPELWASLGHTYKTTGDKQEAINAYIKAISYNPNYGDAYWSLANLKTYSFSGEQIANMEISYNQLKHNDDENLAQICFALGKALESNSEIDKSFHYYQLGNEIKNRLEPYNKEDIEQLIQRSIEFFGNNKQQITANNNANPTTPIFIVGLPRSGSTLLEQILASHSKVDGTKELANIVALARKLGNRKKIQDTDQYPQSLTQLSEDSIVSLGLDYIESTKHLRENAPYFIDKMPNNFLHIGLIKTILPNAKIIDARRKPQSSGFSCFKQLFATGQNFSYDLNNIKHYYQHYLQLMDFWKSIYCDDILTVNYEDVVLDTEQQINEILSFLHLDFEDDCLNFHTNKRAVATASAEQVRQPINTKGLDPWLPFKKYLDQLITI